MTCLRTYITIGFGKVVPLHHTNFDKNFTCGGVIETDVKKHADIEKKGLRVIQTYEEGLRIKPYFWDICCPVDGHVQVIRKIVNLDPQAYILVEKPLCNFDEIPELQRMLKNFQGKIVVNENYLSSETTKKVKEVLGKFKLNIRKVFVEMDKNRTYDFIAGRFIDPKGAFYYEGTHMVTILTDIIKEYQPSGEITKKYEDLQIGERKLEKQGLADIGYTANNIVINLYTSMRGDVKHSYPPNDLKNISQDDQAARYRIVAVKGTNENGEKMTVVGFYEPIKGHDRNLSTVAVIKKKQVVEYLGPFLDNTMKNHLNKATDYFQGHADRNPCSIDEGIEVVKILNTLSP